MQWATPPKVTWCFMLCNSPPPSQTFFLDGTLRGSWLLTVPVSMFCRWSVGHLWDSRKNKRESAKMRHPFFHLLYLYSKFDDHHAINRAKYVCFVLFIVQLFCFRTSQHTVYSHWHYIATSHVSLYFDLCHSAIYFISIMICHITCMVMWAGSIKINK